ncbi:DGQHR domain-containing protein [Billgrantia desiderata]|uniref:DGQHR domain-containing protein n=1 Tax=Billgrantia desiderata TaxID=52021 RepID=UPI00089F0F56|nr:DGQHR domain-containing protein [Halomonas desiderata]SEG14562.1 DGQHR domain-containing protein [Halomonas desiderata]
MSPQVEMFDRYSNKDVFDIPCVPVKQPIGLFFMGSIDYRDLIDITHTDVRRIDGERGFETYLGIQRPLSKKRVDEIAEYVNSFDACFPTAVILSVDGKCAEYDEETGILKLAPYVSETGEEEDEDIPLQKIAKVIDGQHRIEGLKGYRGDEDFQVNVSIFVDIDVASEAYIFSTVNIAQTKINKSLLYDLYDLAESRSPQKLCHDIAVSLNETEGSPLYKRIKRLGVASPHSLPGAITQAAFVQSLMKYISKRPQVDRDLYIRRKSVPRADEKDRNKLIFRDFMIDEKDFELTDIIWFYFSAVEKKWPKAWGSEDKGVMLRRTNGFMALMRYLKDCYLYIEKEVPQESDFSAIFSDIDLDDDHFTTDNYKPGSSGEAALYRKLVSVSPFEL